MAIDLLAFANDLMMQEREDVTGGVFYKNMM
jgi:hypothetical protein